MKIQSLQFIIIILELSSGIACDGEVVKLGQYSIYRKHITISGYSSGGGFAQHLQFSYSSLFSGIAVFQHAFYRCGPGDGISRNYDKACTNRYHTLREDQYNPTNALKDIQTYFYEGLIENPNNLHNKKLYVYTGTYNYFHSPDISLKILNVYEPYVRNPQAIRTRCQSANLTLPTNRFGGPCSEDSKANYYLSNCGLSGPYDALSFLLGHNVIKFSPPRFGEVELGPIQLFNQSEFTKNIQSEHYMDTAGYLYIPKQCKYKKCFIHFYFHGCNCGREFVGEKHIQNSGYLEIAELNSIIMVFPQILSNTGENKYGCWDTYGLTGKLYATQRGTQVIAVRNMISRILGEDK